MTRALSSLAALRAGRHPHGLERGRDIHGRGDRENTGSRLLVSRRQWGRDAARLVTICLGASRCGTVPPSATKAKLSSRPMVVKTLVRAGPRIDGLSADVAISLPANVTDGPVPLVVLLHGAGGQGERLLRRIVSAAGNVPAVLVAPTSGGRTWDAVLAAATTLLDLVGADESPRGFGPDVLAIDRVLDRVFRTVAIDPARCAIGGFSDGATYGLALGLANGGLFSRVLAWSPGFVPDVERVGTPAVFVSHGRSDPVLPIDHCGRKIAHDLRGHGYDVRFREFDGGHEIPDSIAREALAWATG